MSLDYSDEITFLIKKTNELDKKEIDQINHLYNKVFKNYINQDRSHEDFLKKFISKDKNNLKFFEKISNKKYIFDLRGFINKEILSLNIKNVENIEMDTFSEGEFFYSYRRSCLNKEEDYGRCISVILMT